MTPLDMFIDFLIALAIGAALWGFVAFLLWPYDGGRDQPRGK